jgi:hypothetical protein
MYARYPILTCGMILPLSVVRLKELKNPTSIPTVGLFIGVFPIALSGVLNAALYVVTRRRLLLAGGRAGTQRHTAQAMFHVEEDQERPSEPETGNVQVRAFECVRCDVLSSCFGKSSEGIYART